MTTVGERAPLVGQRTLGLLGSIPCAARRLASVLLPQVEMRGDHGRISLRKDAELSWAFHRAFVKYLVDRFEQDPKLEEIIFNFYRTNDEFPRLVEELDRIARAAGVVDPCWPANLELSISRRDGVLTVAYDDWYDFQPGRRIAYQARLMSCPSPA